MGDRKAREEPERIVLKMPRELVKRIRDYRFRHELESRAEAIRELVDFALRHDERRHGKTPKPSKDEPES